MDRQLEPELMVEEKQVMAYAQADFAKPHNHFIELIIQSLETKESTFSALDLGCGPGDISRRFSAAFPNARIDAIDGSQQMIEYGRKLTDEKIHSNLRFILGVLPNHQWPNQNYDIIFSNSLLHHLHDPTILWQSIKSAGQPGSQLYIMDLIRPSNKMDAMQLVIQYTENEPEILQQDFFHSLLAAFTLDEINQQLADASLDFSVEQVSDRHVFVSGRLT